MGPPLSTPASYKRIIICADGTWQTSSSGDGSWPTNVAKMARAIAPTGITADGSLIKQIVYYHPGLGTGALPLQRLIYGGIGWGIEIDICQIYDFISNNYEPNDELFLFGYSRGAFTVRSVAGLVTDIGVLSAVNMAHFSEMWTEYRKNKGGEFRTSPWYLNNKKQLELRDVPIKVIGVWDTVGALGIPEWPWVRTLRDWGWPINQHAFHNTGLSERVQYAFQALATDENRFPFSPTLWHKKFDGPIPVLKQCWFPGNHSNIGGQRESPRDKGDYEGIGWNTLAWMMDNLQGMITFEEAAVESFIDGHKAALDHCKISDASGAPNGWGCGPILNNFDGITGLAFWILGVGYRTPGDYQERRSDGKLARSATNECFHPLLRIRKDRITSYNGKPLSLFSIRNRAAGGWEWARSDTSQMMEEYPVRRDREMSLAYYDNGVVKYKSGDALSWRMCPNSIKSRL